MTRVATLVADGFTLLEGPRWVGDALYVSDFFTERVLRFPSPVDGRWEVVCAVPGRPSGLSVSPDGTLLAVSMLGLGLMRWDGEQLTRFADLTGVVPGPLNDMATDSRGRSFLGNFGLIGGIGNEIEPTTLVRVDPDGSVSPAASDLVFPNGIVFSADERTLLVAETYRGRITAFDIADDGTLLGRRTWVDFGPPGAPANIPAATEYLHVLPDGLALDVDGALWVGDAIGHGIARVAEGGEVLDFVDTGEMSVYAAVLGGPNRTTLFLCCAPPVESFDPTASARSALMCCEVDVPGVPRR